MSHLLAMMHTPQVTGDATRDSDQIQLVVEPTGGYEQALAHFALGRDWRISIPNPHNVRQWAEAVGFRAKTDRVDARMLAEFGAQRDLPAWSPLPEEVGRLEALLHRQESLKKLRQQELNRLHAWSAKSDECEAVRQSIRTIIDTIDSQLERLKTLIIAWVEAHPELEKQRALLQTVPGVGKKNVYLLLVLLHRWGTLTDYTGSSAGLTAYVGLDPKPHRSGTSVYHPTQISKQGNPVYRAMLYLAALGGISGDTAARHFYQRLVGRDKAKQVALVATARKVLIWSWAVFRDRTEFKPHLAGMPA